MVTMRTPVLEVKDPGEGYNTVVQIYKKCEVAFLLLVAHFS